MINKLIEEAEKRTGLKNEILKELYNREKEEAGTNAGIELLKNIEFCTISNSENAVKKALKWTKNNTYVLFAFDFEWNGEKFDNYYYFDKNLMEFIEIF